MKLFAALLLFLSGWPMHAQALTNAKMTQSTQKFEAITDSVLKLAVGKNSIIISTCADYDLFVLIENNTRWQGYFLKNINDIMPMPEGAKPVLTKIISFDADSLQSQLIKNKIYNIKQFTSEQIQNSGGKLVKIKSKEYLEIRSLPTRSHDCLMTISASKQHSVAYLNAWIDSEELFHTESLKIFHTIRELLRNEFKGYYE
jgi:hypothetical protein